MDRRRPILVNPSETQMDAALRDAAIAAGLRVDAKVRIADALVIERSGLSDEAYRYALRAHFDWVMSDLNTTLAQFAVEFDGASHDSPEARRRDRLKDSICRRLGLPLLRVGGAVFRPVAQQTVVGLLVSAWAGWRGFEAAQADGRIAPDEPFHYLGFVEMDTEGRIVQPLDAAGPVKRRIARLATDGHLRHSWPVVAVRDPEPADPDHCEAFAWVETTDGRFVVGNARVRAYSFEPIPSADLAHDLAMIHLGDRLAQWREGFEAIAEPAGRARSRLPEPGRDGWYGGGP